jgi:asparagine synthase (glutamine-hydrolysing)
MCGIAGIVSSAASHNPIVEMTQALLHRGPDAKNTFRDPTGIFSLGHTRLSIIDLSMAANQPFISHSGRYVIVFNGEIYNFKELRSEIQISASVEFKTTSDTEVIAFAFELWQEKMVLKLEGMFAIAILDNQLKKLFLFRDRLGKKPLFYFQSDTLFAFASEIKSLLRHPQIQKQKTVNYNTITEFLHLGYIPEPDTIYNHIYKFPAAHYAEISEQLNLTTTRYWNIHEAIRSPFSNDIRQTDTRGGLKQLLENAVKNRLISDVPLGEAGVLTHH